MRKNRLSNKWYNNWGLSTGIDKRITLKKIYITLFLTVFLYGKVYGQWEVISILPTPVKDCQAVATDSLIYVIGGYNSSKQAGIALIQAFNPYTNKWKEVGNIDISRYGFIAKQYKDSILILGGTTKDSLSAFDMVFWQTNNRILKYSTDFNFNRTFATSEIYNDNIYLIGGYSSQNTQDTTVLPYIVEYNIPQAKVTYIDTNLYRETKPLLQMSALVGEDIYIFGGTQYGIMKEIYKFNVVTHSFTKLEVTLQQARAGGVAVYDRKERIYIIGGTNEALASLAYSEIYMPYSLNNNIYNAPPLNHPRTEFAAVYFKDYIYVFGGRNSFDQIVPEVEVLNTSVMTSTEDTKSISGNIGFKLSQNYPNPFNSSTVINFQLYKRGFVSLKIFDVLGNEIKNLINEEKPAGAYKIPLDASSLTSGFYIVRLTVNSQSVSNKILLLK